jgi:DNA polymerase V
MTNRGGKRENAGRPRGQGQFGESTVAIRIPQSQETVIRDFLSTLIVKRTQQNQDTVTAIFALSPAKHHFLLPLYTSKVVAGFPSPADDHVEKRLNPNDYLIVNDNSTFFVQVKGDSMIDAGIFEKDVLVVDRSRTAQTGDIVLAVLDGEFTIKILGQSEAGACLIPANKNYPVIQIKENQSFEVWGVITGSMRKFK